MWGGFGTSIVLNSVVIYPVTKKILLAKDRVPSLERRKALAVLFLAMMGLASVAMDLYQVLLDRNLFKIMQLPRTAEDKDVRVAYQRLARELHPDKNRDMPGAEEAFVEMKHAYDTLANPVLRDVYDRWGYEGLRWAEKDSDVLSQGLLQLGITYVIWFALTILLTVSSSQTHARTISLAGLSVILALDLQMRTGEFALAVPLFSHLAVYQISKLLFTIYPTWIGGTIVFQNFTYSDPVDRNWKLLSVVFQRQDAIMTNLNNLEQELRLTGKVGALPNTTGAAPGHGIGASSGGASSLPRNLQAKNAQAGGVQQPKKRSGIPSWAFMIGFYVLFNYVLK